MKRRVCEDCMIACSLMAVSVLLIIALVSRAALLISGEPKYEQGVVRVNEGERMLTQIRQYGEHPRYGRCWTRALEEINEGCKRLTDDEQSYLALTFANCHLEKAGLPSYPCESGTTDIQTCLSQLRGDAVAFNAYTEFFTHTQDICFFLQSQVWHEQTEQTVSRLAQSSEDVAVKMEVTGKLQEEMIEKQGASLMQQDLILQNEEKLRDALQTSSQDIKNVFAEMKDQTQNQQRLFEETFSRVGDIQRLILGEFSWFNSLLFFAAAVLIAYIVTSAPRTSGARLWLFIILGVDLVVERGVFQVVGGDQAQLYDHMWFCRKCFCAIALVVLFVCAYRYKDLATVNNMLLLEIRRQNSELCRVMKGIGVNSYPALGGNNVATALQSSGAAAMSLVAGHKPLSLGRDYSDSMWHRTADNVTAIDGYSSEDFTSTDTEPTYIGAQSSTDTDELSDTESFITANQASQPVSRRVSLEGQRRGSHQASNDSFMQGLNNSVNTPFQSNTPDATFTGSSSTTKRKRGRPKGSRSRQSTPQSESCRTPTQTRYNLRTRVSESFNNSILNTETVQMFVERIGASLGQRTYRAERVQPRRRNVTSFSSDDEY
ncbi:uncharacterized protein LOC119737533 isoform X2 [Patiria miniata]|uniref:Uncharacterized protein n=1 Tax=Patiria miniata TaxID=46514 RepID=A0A914AVV7_PATMI|nr:uncharacterized protein LOC119737533 isoform X2 [Patiria miniata]